MMAKTGSDVDDTGRNLRQLAHNLTFPTDVIAITKKNFVYRMLFFDVHV